MMKQSNESNSDKDAPLNILIPSECPHCGDNRIIYKAKASLWQCENCEERFPGGAPESGIRRLDDKATRPKAIFFSYGHDENRDLVRLFKNDLEKRGHQIWFDEKDIGEWDDWKGKITRGIDSSQLAIAFMSKHSIRDPGVCRNEIAIAMNRFGAVYPVLLEANIEQDIPITIRHLQWPDLSQWLAIRDGEVPGIEWNRWYEERLLSLIEKIEGDATQFADETRVLERILNPITAESKITQHVPNFVGREWIFDAYREWVDLQPDSRLFWIKAGPGVGKSAIAANLIHRERSAIVAGWFCDTKSGERKDPNRAIRSIAFQLALRWEDYRVRLLRKLQVFANTSEELCEDARKELEKKNTHDLFTHLLAEPMTGLIWRDHKLVIVIDALDEAVDDEGNNRITELLSNELNSLPPWIGFVVTSRPEADVVNQLQGFKPYELNTADPRNVADLKSWYRKHLGRREEIQALSLKEQEQIEDMLIDRSGGMILYLKVIEEGFKESSLTFAKLGELESGLPGLYRRYYDSFLKRFKNDYEEEIKPLLRLLLAAGGPLPEDLACETLGCNSEQLLACRNRLGSYVIENISGYELFHKTLAEWLSDKSSGSFHLDRSVGRQMLADILFEELSEKETHLVRWKEMLSKWLPDWLPQLSQFNDSLSISNLGIFFQNIGNYAVAEPLLHLALTNSEKMEGPEHSLTGVILNYLARLQLENGDYDGAENFFRRALLISEKVNGSEHNLFSVNLADLALVLQDKGDYEGSEPLLRRALLISEKVNGSEHSSTATTLMNLGLLLQDKGDYEGAESLLRRALVINEKVNGSEHPETGISSNNLGTLLYLKGDYEGAELLYRKALSISEKLEGPEHPSTLTYLNNIGLSLHDKGDYEGAEHHYRKSLSIREKVLGPEHISILEGLINLGSLHYDNGDYKEAEPLLRRALVISETIEGPMHRSTANCMLHLGILLKDKGDYKDAEIFICKAFAIYETVGEADREYILITMQNLAEAIRDIGDLEKAEQLILKVIEGFIRLDGVDSLNVAGSFSAMGKLMSLKGDMSAAKIYYQKALDIRQAKLGENDELTLLVRSRLNEL